jgi:hypothetical protein
VKFTVRPVIVLVVDGTGRPIQLWTNIAGRPTSAELRGLLVRRGTPRGAPVAMDDRLSAEARAVVAAASWGGQGLVWQRR